MLPSSASPAASPCSACHRAAQHGEERLSSRHEGSLSSMGTTCKNTCKLTQHPAIHSSTRKVRRRACLADAVHKTSKLGLTQNCPTSCGRLPGGLWRHGQQARGWAEARRGVQHAQHEVAARQLVHVVEGRHHRGTPRRAGGQEGHCSGDGSCRFACSEVATAARRMTRK